tara:strand:- start:48 stop:707 length:660 start_codon:yes stop_codon:yes gene_type:complete
MKNHIRIEDINDKGIIVINNIFDNDEFSKINSEINKLIQNKRSKNGKIVLIDDDLKESLLFELYKKNKIKTVVNEIFNHNKLQLDIEDNYKVLRVLTGNNSDNDNQNYHFDGYYLTAMLPILIPKEKDNFNGDFLIAPNIRHVYKHKKINLLIKYFFQNKIAKIFYKTIFFNKIFKPIKISPQENSLILFKGFESLHGSEMLGKNRTRITLLYHFNKMK